MASGEQYIPLLRNISLFEGVCDDEMMAVVAKSRVVDYKKKSIIVTEGDESDAMYIVLSGSLRVYTTNENGKELTLRILNTGDHFGELAIIDGESRSASVVCDSDASFLVLRKSQVYDVVSNSSRLALNLTTQLAQRVRELTKKLEIFGTVNAPGRVAWCLLELGEENDNGLHIKSGVTHRQIAEMTGCSREMVSRIMKDFENAGYLQVINRRIIVTASGVDELHDICTQ